MLHSNGQSTCCKCQDVKLTFDNQQVSRNKESLLPSQVEFIELVRFHGASELSKSLKLIHDLALYHSDVTFDEDEKVALFNLKVLWESLEKIEQES